MDDNRRRILTLLWTAGVSTLAGCSVSLTEDDILTETPADGTDDPAAATETASPPSRKLAAEDGDSDDRFGASVGVSGDGTTSVIGDSLDDDPNGTDAGSAYVFGP
jgi:hypothetical protein